METKKLKTIIKGIVKECLNEILAEQYIKENLVKGRVKEKQSINKAVRNAMPVENKKSSSLSPGQRREAIDRILGENKHLDPYKDIFEDTANSGSPILSSNDSDTNPEFVSESALEKAGVMDRDWSRFL